VADAQPSITDKGPLGPNACVRIADEHLLRRRRPEHQDIEQLETRPACGRARGPVNSFTPKPFFVGGSMQQRQQYQVESLRRVQTILDTHADLVGLKDTEARKQLDIAIERANAHALDQALAERELAGVGHQVKQRAGELKTSHMTPVAKFSRANLRGVPDFKALAHVPHSLRGHRLVVEARAMATAALPYSSMLDAAQFPPNSVQALGAAADGLEKAFDVRAAAQSRKVIATAGVREEIALGREAVAMLDPIVIKRFAGKKDLLAGWRSAKRVRLTPQAQPDGAVASIGTALVVAPAEQGVKAA
jgi:DNA-nicking Smr family endonuclease